MTTPADRPIHRLPEPDRYARLVEYLGDRVELVHAPLRGQEQEPDRYVGVLLAVARHMSGTYTDVAVIRPDNGARDVAIPSAQIASIREARR